MSSIESRVIAVIVRQLRVEEKAVTPDASIADDLGGDSLRTVELIMALEDEFGLQIPDNDVEDLTTVRQVVDYIARATNGIAHKSMRPPA
jgi:acyl carrier protein